MRHTALRGAVKLRHQLHRLRIRRRVLAAETARTETELATLLALAALPTQLPDQEPTE
jgi:hypothetical protein